MRQPISTFSINWEGKRPGYYVRRVSRDGYVTGHLTENGGWSTPYRSRAFNTPESAIAAANATGAHRFDVLVNKFKPTPAPMKPVNSALAQIDRALQILDDGTIRPSDKQGMVAGILGEIRETLMKI